MNNHPVNKLISYLKSLKKLVAEVDPEGQVYKEGTNAGQIAFHATQTVNFWLRVRMMGLEFARDKDSEMTKPHSLEEINKAIDLALAACEDLKNSDLKFNSKLNEEVPMSNGEYVIDTVGTGLIFLTGHTSEHVAELTMLRDYVSTLT